MKTNDMPHAGTRRLRTPHSSRATANPRAGFTLLLAVMVSSIVLAIGVSIFDIVQKQIQLSSLSRDSQFAFYNADTAADCALYWDVRRQVFSTTTPPDPKSIGCDGQTMESSWVVTPHTDLSGNWSSTDFTYQYAPNGQCAQVIVRKSLSTVNGITALRTLIHTDGFNTTCSGVSNDQRALQRSVELNY